MTIPARRFARPFLVGLPALALVFAGCGDDDGDPEPGPVEEVQLTLEGLPAGAEGDGDFELWISFAVGRTPEGLRHSTAASAGRFHVGPGGLLLDPAGGPAAFGVDPASDFVPLTDDGKVAWQLALDAFVTLEPRADVDAEPGEPNLPAVLGGNFLNGQSVLGTDHPDAVDETFAGASGTFHLATPTTAATADEVEGIWFAVPGGAGASLSLPAAPVDWSYQAWLSRAGLDPVSLGRFSGPTGADSDGAGPNAGPEPGYAFPGSDFPAGAGTDPRPGTVLITIEPPQDADGAGRPSFWVVLSAPLDAAQASGVEVPLENVSTAPSGTATIPFHP